MDQNKLTPREIEVLRLVAKGLTNQTIAKMLYTTTGTVNLHVHHIIQKLGVSNRTQAVTWAIRNGLTEDDAKSS